MESIGIRFNSPTNTYDPEWDAVVIEKINRCLSPLGEIVKATYGYEVGTKNRKHHFHYHIQIDNTNVAKKFPSAIFQWIKAHIDMKIEKGQFAVQNNTKKQQDINRWHGYLFKDLESYEDIVMIHQIGFSGEELKLMWSAAAAERKAAIKQFEKHENKLNNDKQERRKVWSWLDEQLPDLAVPDQKIHDYARGTDPLYIVGSKIVEYNKKYNDYKIPMDLKRRCIQYLAYRNIYDDTALAMLIMR